MWSTFSSTGSAIATNSFCAVPEYGFVTVMSDIACSRLRAVGEPAAGFPVM